MPKGLKKAMSYLGLVEEAEYDEESFEDEQEEEYAEEQPFQSEVVPMSKFSKSLKDNTNNSKLENIETFYPKTYNDAQQIGRSFRAGTPVIINLYNLSDSDAKRIVDFSAGLVYGLAGSIKDVAPKVFLLSPRDIKISSEGDTSDGTESKNFYNQS
jgi:cell division inhibitor SepF